MEKIISFVIINSITSAILGIICIIFLYFVVSNIVKKYYKYDGFWEKFGMFFMFVLFVILTWCGIQMAPVLELSIDGNCIVCILAVIYLLVSCKLTKYDIWDLFD